MYESILRAAASVRARTDFEPRVLIVLGSGLGSFADSLKTVLDLPYGEIDGFPVSTVAGHDGRLVFGYIEDVPVVIMRGRVHYYECLDPARVVLPLRVCGVLGAKHVILTNASGGINESYMPGDFMLISDHISSLVPSPLGGRNLDSLGVRFPDMSEVYDAELRRIARDSASQLGITLHEGVYIQTAGPNYETPAEIRMFRSWGADAVGMSTATEAIAARHMGLSVCGISCISNAAAGVSEEKLSHEDVSRMTSAAAPRFKALISRITAAL